MIHTLNLCSAFNPSKVHTHTVNTHTHTHTRQWTHTHREHTHTAVNIHTPWTHIQSSGQPFMLRRPGSSWGFGALLKGTSVVALLQSQKYNLFYCDTVDSAKRGRKLCTLVIYSQVNTADVNSTDIVFADGWLRKAPNKGRSTTGWA